MICIAGKNNIAVAILELALRNMNLSDIVALPVKEDTGKDTWQRSLRKAALTNQVPVIQLEDAYEIDNLVLLSLEYNQIIKPNLFKDARLYNIHFSLLPAYKGMYTSYWPIKNGEHKSGVTLHLLDRGIDTGDIIAQQEYEITPNMTSRDMYLMNLQCGIQLVSQYFDKLLSGNIKSIPQDYVNSSYYSKKSLDYQNIIVDLNQTAYNIKKQVYALVFREYQLPYIKGHPIVHACVETSKSVYKPGTLLQENDISITISTIDYDVTLFKDQLFNLLSYCENGNLQMVKQLLEAGYDVNMQNEKGWTPLIVACYHGKKEVAELLIQYGADVNLTNYKGTTPLMYAKNFSVKYNDFSIMEKLIFQGSDILQKDNRGNNVLEYAKKDDSIDLSFLL